MVAQPSPCDFIIFTFRTPIDTPSDLSEFDIICLWKPNRDYPFFQMQLLLHHMDGLNPFKTLPTTSAHRLVLKDYEAIDNASKAFAANPQLAETTQIIVIEEELEKEDEEDQEDDEEDDEEEQEEDEQKQEDDEELEEDQEDQEEDEQEQEEDEEVDNTKIDNKFRAITAILTDCSRHGKLEAFKWHSRDGSSTRPAEFWQALTKVAPTLQHFSFNFHVHELHRMKKMGISAEFPSTFPVLKSLYIDCSGAHGDDGSPIDKLLHGLPNLRVLHIDAPICDLESCRIQGLTWAYKFPQLTHLSISIFYQSAQDMGSFLANHPNIHTLMYNAEGEEPIPNAASLLPNLEALSMKNWGQTAIDGYTELLSANPPRKITYFMASPPYNKYRLIPQYAPSLRCLELNLDIEDIRNEDIQYGTMITFLPLVPDLFELAIRFSSGWTTVYDDEDETSRNPLPMDEEILSNILEALPKSSNLQVLRMKDNDEGKGSPLSVQSSAFASLREDMPSSLKVLQWELDNSRVRYEFEPGQSVRIVDPPEQHWPDTLLWTDESILKHLGAEPFP